MAQSTSPAGVAPPGGTTVGGQGSSSSKVDKITSISFKGNKKFTEKQLLEAIKTKVGDDLSQEKMNVLLGRIVDFYRNNGANLTVQPNLAPDMSKGTVAVEFIIDESGTKGNGGQYEPGGSGGRSGGQSGGAPPAGGSLPSGSGK